MTYGSQRPTRNPWIDTLIICLALLLIIWIIAGHPGITIWEDGSFGIGAAFPYPLTGCLPWGICN